MPARKHLGSPAHALGPQTGRSYLLFNSLQFGLACGVGGAAALRPMMLCDSTLFLALRFPTGLLCSFTSSTAGHHVRRELPACSPLSRLPIRMVGAVDLLASVSIDRTPGSVSPGLPVVVRCACDGARREARRTCLDAEGLGVLS